MTVSDAPNICREPIRLCGRLPQSNNYSVRFLSGNSEGRIYPITANGANTLTSGSNLGNDTLAAVQPNDLFVIEPLWTLSTLFPNGPGNLHFTNTG